MIIEVMSPTLAKLKVRPEKFRPQWDVCSALQVRPTGSWSPIEFSNVHRRWMLF